MSPRVVMEPSGKLETDLVAVIAFENEPADRIAPAGGEAAAGALRRALGSGEFSGRLYDTFTATVPDRVPDVLVVGGGRRDALDLERLRKLAATAGLVARKRRSRRVAFVVPELAQAGLAPASAVQAIVEGVVHSSFDGGLYKTQQSPSGTIDEIIVAVAAGNDAGALQRAANRGQVLGESSNMARALCTEPSNVLTPRVFAERATAIARDAGVQVDVLEEDAIARLKMGLLLGVARGSAEPPRLVVLRHEPAGAPADRVLGIVGKGITFDTGGISIKPAEAMDRMKDDMSGGAAVICAMRALSLLGAPIRVIGVVPMTENMPGGRALKPGDVLTGASGKTVEILNTDAEGRLILGDALWYARQLGATHLLDVATLTGACVVALGRASSGLFAQPDTWRDIVRDTANAAGDRVWPMPLYDEYFDQLKSEIADFTNTGGRPAGACTAAMFIRQFAGDGPWAHLDIAATAWAEESQPFQPKGATGVAVRTLAELAFTSGRWP